MKNLALDSILILFHFFILSLPQQFMKLGHTEIDFESQELSKQFFGKCSELAIIAKPFNIAAAGQEAATRDLESEFELVRALTETKKHKLKLRVNTILENKKNRYPQQSIYEHSRVRLDDSEGEGYINANWVPLPVGRLIITQGPLQATQEHFEQMILQNQVQCVAMLCNVIESGKVRCFDYTANRNTTLQKGEDPIVISKVEIDGQEYVHLHYSQWPDRSVPEDNAHVRQLLQVLANYQRVAIHCSAGLGRSGVIACLLSLLQQVRQGQDISVFGTALRLREHRFGAIQNSQQYAYIYRFLHYLQSTS